MNSQIVAKVAVDTPLSHLDRPFDYSVPEQFVAQALPGVRVRVRFAGKLRDGYLLSLEQSTEQRELSPLNQVATGEQVLSPELIELIRAVADHYAGGFADVARLAIPPRHLATERATPPKYPAPKLPDYSANAYLAGFGAYPFGIQYLAALAEGRSPRASWTLVPAASKVGNWIAGFVAAAEHTLLSGRGVLLIVPDQKDLAALGAVIAAHFGKGSYVALSASDGPAARYRRFLAASRGQVRIVIGNRAAVFAPVSNLGLVALWDDGEDVYSELRAPYPHAREVAAIRAHLAKCALLFGGYARTAEVEQLVQRHWLQPIGLDPLTIRALAPRVVVAEPRPEQPGTSRIPTEVFSLIRNRLPQGPVLIQVLNQARRTAAELGKAFPGAVVSYSSADHPLSEISAASQLVFATPGSEPPASSGYAAAVLLDANAMSWRADLRAGEEALRRWLRVTAQVRPAADGGTVLVTGAINDRSVQALVRLDPVGFAERELSDRAAASFPPVVKLVRLEADQHSLIAALEQLELPETAESLGPLPTEDPETFRLTLRAPAIDGAKLVQAVKVLISVRTAHKKPPIKVQVDPQVVE